MFKIDFDIKIYFEGSRMFWVDEIVEDITKKLSDDTKENLLITDWKTPSGHAHFGSLRGPVIHEVIRRGLTEAGKKAVFRFGIDDFDPMDGLPVYIDQSFKKYMGMPLNKVPAPDGKSKNYSDQYANELKDIISSLGGKVEYVSVYDAYKEGKYNESIKLILDSTVEIRKIYKDISGSDKGDDWYPFQVVCPKCGKIGTTVVTGWNGKEVDYSCEENLVEWAQGCGVKGKMSPFDGNGKLLWKVEWPSKWHVFGTDIEGEGKDHFAAGGSRDVADKIYRDIFKKQPPYDIRYEHFLFGGAKMSSSKGLGVTALDMAELLPANILRFLFTRTKYKKALEFNPEGDTIPLLYDEYDRCALAFQEDPKSDQGRAYYYSIPELDSKVLERKARGSYFAEIDTEEEKPKYLLRFSKIAYMLQMPRVDILEYAKEEKESDLTEEEKIEIENRIVTAEKWLEKFASENYKFTIQDNIPDKAKELNDAQKEFLKKLSSEIQNNNYSGPEGAPLGGEDLHKKIHEIKAEMNIEPRLAFTAIYRIFIGKDSGPQAGWLLASLDKEFVINRLESATRGPAVSGEEKK